MLTLILASITTWMSAQYVWSKSVIGFFQSFGVWIFGFLLFTIVFYNLEFYVSKLFFPDRARSLEGLGQGLGVAGPFLSVILAFVFYLWQAVKHFLMG